MVKMLAFFLDEYVRKGYFIEPSDVINFNLFMEKNLRMPDEILAEVMEKLALKARMRKEKELQEIYKKLEILKKHEGIISFKEVDICLEEIAHSICLKETGIAGSKEELSNFKEALKSKKSKKGVKIHETEKKNDI